MTTFLSRARRTVALAALLALGGLVPLACTSNPNEEPERLSVYGLKHAAPTSPSDTLPDPIPNFRLINQMGQPVTNQTFAGKVYIADFFFTSCPSICPKMQSEMLRVYKAFEGNPNVLFLSHTIDPSHDSIPVLRDYAERLGIKDASRWHFARTQQDTVFKLASAYVSGAQIDKQAAGGFAHDGAFVLVDSKRRIRGVYDGMVKEQVDRLIAELPVLLKEEQLDKPVAAQ